MWPRRLRRSRDSEPCRFGLEILGFRLQASFDLGISGLKTRLRPRICAYGSIRSQVSSYSLKKLEYRSVSCPESRLGTRQVSCRGRLRIACRVWQLRRVRRSMTMTGTLSILGRGRWASMIGAALLAVSVAGCGPTETPPPSSGTPALRRPKPPPKRRRRAVLRRPTRPRAGNSRRSAAAEREVGDVRIAPQSRHIPHNFPVRRFLLSL